MLASLRRLNKNNIYWILQITGWSLNAAILIFFLFLDDSLEAKSVVSIILSSAYFLFSTHRFRYYIKKHNWLEKPFWSLLSHILVANFLLAISNYVFQIIIFFFLNTLRIEQDFQLFSVVSYIFGAMIYYIVWSLIYFIYHYFDRYNRTLKYEATIKEFELNRLKSQLNPHFIFNALNSIRALVDEDPKRCKTAITQLSSILRSSLVMNTNKLAPFGEELKAVEDYLELETIRYEERLRTYFDVDKASYSFNVPPLMLQTLVENGIKHGISQLKNGGDLKLSTKVNDDKLLIQIRNSGQYKFVKNGRKNGFGIDNTVQRLQIIYNNSAHFSIKNEDNSTVLTEVEIPKNIN